jgi:hypothetical protein
MQDLLLIGGPLTVLAEILFDDTRSKPTGMVAHGAE